MSGGSAANTMCGVASFGGQAAYIGKVSGDSLGAVFGHDLNAVGVAFRPGAPDHGTPTGRSIIVVTPDAQRTMNTYLGAAELLSADDLDEAAIADGAVLYMEGYLFDRDEAKKAFRRAAGVAHEHGRKVSLTLSDSFCVDRHRADFAALIQDEVDILFGNAEELRSLYQLDSTEAAIDIVRARVRAGGDHRRQGRLGHRHRRRRPARARRARRPRARHDRSGRPLRRRLPVRLHARAVARRVRPARLDRRGRGDQPRRATTAGRAADALAVTVDDVRATAGRWLDAEPDDDIRDELERPARRARRRAGRPVRWPADVRHRRVACRRRRRTAAHEPPRRPPGGARSRRPPAGDRSGCRVAWRRRRLRRPAQERRLRPRHRPRDRRRRCARAPAARAAPDACARLVGHRARRGGRGDGHGVAQPAGRQRLQGVPRRRRPDRPAARRARSPSASLPSTRRWSRWPTPTTIASSGSDGSIVDRYVASMRSVRLRPATTGVLVAYTPMHGVGGELVLRAFDAAGLPAPVVVDEQFQPDPAFPTVSFPNPEEPGAMDLVVALADEQGRHGRPRQRSRCRPPRRGDPAARRVVAPARWRRDRVAARRPHPDQHRRATTGSSSPRSCRRRCCSRWPTTTGCTSWRRSPGSSGWHGRCSTGPTCGWCSPTSRRWGTS